MACKNCKKSSDTEGVVAATSSVEFTNLVPKLEILKSQQEDLVARLAEITRKIEAASKRLAEIESGNEVPSVSNPFTEVQVIPSEMLFED